MNAPFNLGQGNILLLTQPNSFSASYIRRSLEMFGLPVLAPAGAADAILAALDPIEWLSISACIVVDIGRDMFDMLSAQRTDVPFIFVGGDPGEWLGSYNWLRPPFAAFQVVDLLAEMVAATSRPMRGGSGVAACG